MNDQADVVGGLDHALDTQAEEPSLSMKDERGFVRRFTFQVSSTM